MSAAPTNGNGNGKYSIIGQVLIVLAIVGGAWLATVRPVQERADDAKHTAETLATAVVAQNIALAALQSNQSRIETQMERRGQLSYLREYINWIEADQISWETRGRGLPSPPVYMYENGSSGNPARP